MHLKRGVKRGSRGGPPCAPLHAPEEGGEHIDGAFTTHIRVCLDTGMYPLARRAARGHGGHHADRATIDVRKGGETPYRQDCSMGDVIGSTIDVIGSVRDVIEGGAHEGGG
eukprot:1196307-Prorocentrum_minimum.AAC.17